jgi:hypothetical protein
MTNTLRTITQAAIIIFLLLLTGAAAPSSTSTRTAPPTSTNPTRITSEPLADEDQAWIDFAFAQFDAAGIELPDVSIAFPSQARACHGFGGLYVPSKRAVRICKPSERTIIHELAHAWIETTLTDGERQSFLQLRGLTTWTGGDEWDQRGAEQAAEIIAWAVMEKDMSFRWLATDDDGATVETWRLLKIPNSNPDLLATAYESLTGNTPELRLASDPRLRVTEATTSPELQRARGPRQ